MLENIVVKAQVKELNLENCPLQDTGVTEVSDSAS